MSPDEKSSQPGIGNDAEDAPALFFKLAELLWDDLAAGNVDWSVEPDSMRMLYTVPEWMTDGQLDVVIDVACKAADGWGWRKLAQEQRRAQP